MRRKSGFMWFRAIAGTLILSTFWLGVAQPKAEAMLVPSTAMRPDNSGNNRTADMATIQKTLESQMLRDKLHALGLSDAEIQTRLSRLSDTQMHQLALQIRAVNPGGDLLIGLLVAVVLILLIIYLLKRIIL